MANNIKPIHTPKAATIKNWSKNASKSFAYSSLNVLKSITPNTAATVASAADVAKDMRNFAYRTRSTMKQQGNILDRNSLGRSAKEVFDSAMNDIKTGNFSLQHASADALDNFDDVFGNDFSTSGDPELVKEAGLGKVISYGNAATIDSLRDMTNVIANTQLKSAQMMSNKSANITMFGINKLNASIMGVNNRLDAINANLVAMINFQNQNVSVTNQAMLQYFDQSMEILNKLNKSMTMGRGSQKDNNLDFLFGGIDFKGYGKNVKKNFNNTLFGSMLGMAKTFYDMDKAMGSGPKRLPKMALEQILIPALMGGNLRNSLSFFDRNIPKYAKAGLYKLGDLGNDYSKGGTAGTLLRFIGQVLGVERPKLTGTNMGIFHKDSMMWNGEAQRTLVEVIPSYLSKMEASLSILSGANDKKISSRQRFYDMESGKFKSRSGLEREYRDERQNELISATNDTMTKISQYLKQNKVSDKDRTDLEKMVSDMVQDRVYNNTGYSSEYRSKLSKLNSNFSRDQSKQITLMLEDAIENAVSNLSKQNRRIQTETSGSKYRYLFNNAGHEIDQNKHVDLFASAFNWMGTDDPESEIQYYLSELKIDPSTFHPSGKFIGDFNRQKMTGASESQLKSLVRSEYNRQQSTTIRNKFKSTIGKAGAWHSAADRKVYNTMDWADTQAYNIMYGKDTLGGASSRATSHGNTNTVKPKRNRQLESNIQSMPKTFHEVENLTPQQIEGSLHRNAAAMLNETKNVPSSAISSNSSATIAGLEANTDNLVQKGSSLIDSLKQTVVSLHSGTIDIIAGLVGKNGFLKTAFSSDWMKENMKSLKTYLFDEKDGVFKDVTKSFLDVADYMKYVFNGKSYTDRKGESHPDTDNAVFKYLNKGYQFIFGNTMKYLFGDDYQSNEVYQKYFSWLGGKGAREATKTSKAKPKTSNIYRNNQKLLTSASGNSSQLALPAYSGGNALVSVPVTDSNGKTTVQSFDSSDTESIHAATEQNIVNSTTHAILKIDEGSKAISTIITGDENGSSEKVEKSFMQKFKDNLPKMLTSGIVGAGITLASGGSMGLLGLFLPSGIVGGAIVGMGLQLATQSKKFNDFVFGKTDDKTGEKTNGLISQKLQASFKKSLPLIVGGGVIGAITHGGLVSKVPGVGLLANTLLPGGILGGALLGLGTSLLMHNETFTNILFGEKDADGKRVKGKSTIFNGTQKIMSAVSPYIKPALKGAGIGALSGLVLSKMGVLGAAMSVGGPVGMGLLGLGVGIASTTEKFKKFMFGDEELDKDGNPTGNRLKNGLMSKLQAMLMINVFEPIADSMHNNMTNFAYWARLHIMDPFKMAFQPLVTQLQDIGDYIKEKIDKLSDGIMHVISGTFKKIFAPVTKIVGKAVSGVIWGASKSLEIALSPIAGGLKLVNMALSPGRAVRDIDFARRYMKGEYGDKNRTTSQRLGDVFNVFRDKGADEGSYFSAHDDYNDEMRSQRKRVNDWNLRKDHRETAAEFRAKKKDDANNRRLTKYRQSLAEKWKYNESILLSDRETSKIQRDLSRKFGIDPSSVQNEDQIKQLIFHRSDWNDKYNTKASPVNGPAASTADTQTYAYQNNVESKLTTIANLISRAFFGKKVFGASGSASFTAPNVDDIGNTEAGMSNNQTEAQKNNTILGKLLQVATNGEYDPTNKNSVGKVKFEQKDAQKYYNSASEIGQATGSRITSFFSNIFNKQKKDQKNQAQTDKEAEESAEMSSGTQSLLALPGSSTSLIPLTGTTTQTKQKSFLGKILSGVGNVFSGIGSLFTPKTALTTIKYLGLGSLLGVAGYDILSGIGTHVMSYLDDNHPKIYSFLMDKVAPFFTETLPMFWTEKVQPFLQETLPKFIINSVETTAAIIQKNAPLIVDGAVSLIEAVVPVIGTVVKTLISDAFSWAKNKLSGSSGTLNTTSESNSEANINGLNTYHTGQYNSNGEEITYTLDDNEEVDANGNITKVSSGYTGKFTRLGANIYKQHLKTVGVDAAKVAAKASVSSSSKSFLIKMLNKSLTVMKSISKFGPVAKIFAKCDGMSTAVGKGWNTLISSGLQKLSSANAGVLSSLAAKIRNKLYGETAQVTAGAATAGIMSALFAAYDLANGAFAADRLFNIDADSVDWKMRLISSLLTAILGTTAGVVVDIAIEILSTILDVDIKSQFASLIYDLTSDTADEAKLETAQKQLDAEATLYNNANGTNLSGSEYSKKKNTTLLGTLWNKIKNLVGAGDDTNYNDYENQAEAIISNGGSVTKVGQTYSQTVKTTTTYDVSGSNNTGYGNAGYGQPKLKSNIYNGPGAGSTVSQNDPKWANFKIGTLPDGRPSTMAAGGCGPTALSTAANIVGYGTDMSPVGIAKFAKSNGYIEQGGSSSKLFTEGASKLGMSSTRIDPSSIKQSIYSGHPVIISGRSNNVGMGNEVGSPYTSAGHIVTATGVDNKGNVIIDDPLTGSRKSYNSKQLTNGMTNAWSMSKGIGYGRGSRKTIGYGTYGSGGGRTSATNVNSSITITKWGSLGKSKATKYNPFALSSKELNFTVKFATLTNMHKNGQISDVIWNKLLRYKANSGINDFKYNTFNNMYKSYILSNNTSTGLTYLEYAALLYLLGMIRYYSNKVQSSTVQANARTGLSFTMADITVTKYGEGGSTSFARGNPFALSASQLNTYLTASALKECYNSAELSTTGYNTVYSKLHQSSTRRSQRVMTLKELSTLYSGGKIKFADYAALLKYAGVIMYHLRTTPSSDTVIPTSLSSDIENSISNYEYKSAATGLLDKLSYMAEAFGLLGSRIFNSPSGGYQRIYDDDGNPIDTDFIEQFQHTLLYGSSSDSSDFDAGDPTTSVNMSNIITPSDLKSEVASYVASTLLSAESGANYSAINANDNGAYSVGAIQFHGNNAKNMFTSIANRLTNSTLKAQALQYANLSGSSLSSDQKEEMKAFLTDSQVSPISASVQNQMIKDFIMGTDMQYTWPMYTSGILKDPRSVILPSNLANTAPAWASDWKGKYTKSSTKSGELAHVKDSLLTDSKWRTSYKSRINSVYDQIKNVSLKYDTAGYGPGVYYGTADDRLASMKNFYNNFATTMGNKYGISIGGVGNDSTDTASGINTSSSSNSKMDSLVQTMRGWKGGLIYTQDGSAPDTSNYTKGCCTTTVNAAYRKVLGTGHNMANLDNRAGYLYKDNRFAIVDRSGIDLEGNGTGRTPNTSALMPGDLLFYKRSKSTRDYKIGHVEMYTGDNTRIGHGGPGRGPTEKSISNDASDYVLATRWKGFMNQYSNAGYGNGSYYGNPGIINKLNGYGATFSNGSAFNLYNNSIRKHASDNDYYGDVTDTSSTTDKRITARLTAAQQTSDLGEKVNSIIEIMKDWYAYDKSKPAPTSTAIVANNGNQTNNNSSSVKSSSDSKLMAIHQKLSSGKR